jgi:hypothetical protein
LDLAATEWDCQDMGETEWVRSGILARAGPGFYMVGLPGISGQGWTWCNRVELSGTVYLARAGPGCYIVGLLGIPG